MARYINSKEYYIGYQRGLNDKFTPDSFWDALSFDKLLNTTSIDEKERERGFKDGRKARDIQRWGKLEQH